MGLRCSLLGHAYADPEIDRDRDDRGDEVVVTVRETKTCERCGAETVVSENTEVRPVEPEPAPEPDPEPDTDTTVSPGVDDEFEPPASAAEDDAVILDDGSTEDPAPEDLEREPGEWPDADDTRVEAEAAPEQAASEADPDSAPDANADAEVEAETSDSGGEIIDGEDDSGVEVEDASPSGDWPEPGADVEDEGFDADPASSDDGDIEMGGLTPQGVAEAEADGETVVGGESFDSGIESTGSAGADPTADVDVEAEFVCPACGYVESVLNSSLREGDICPECQRGYLSEESPTRN